MNQQIKITRHKRKAVELEIDGILTPVGKIQPTSSEGLLPRPINLRGREVLINPIRHCEERSDVAISSGSSLLFFLLAPSSPRALSPSVFKGMRISSFIFYSKENNL